VVEVCGHLSGVSQILSGHTDDNGVGDLNGITERLRYFVDLGVDAIWISPIFRSPMADFGYDVSDYVDIDPIFGSMDDFERLVANAHALGIRIILDFVPNHSSDRHPRFIESRRSRSNPNGTGTSGAILHQTVDRLIIGCPSLAAAPGNSIRFQANTITMPFSDPSQT
jgi:glycosidase